MLRLKLNSFDVVVIGEHERRSWSAILGSYKNAFFLELVRNQLSWKLAHNINRLTHQVKTCLMQTNKLSLTCTQTILSHCFEFVPQDCLGDWDRAFERLPTYLFHRGSDHDVVQENWILKKNDFFFSLFLEKQNFPFFFFLEQDVILWTTILENHSV